MLFVILICFIQTIGFTQAELDRVRDMFGNPEAAIPVTIWKGNVSQTHAVEFYLAEYQDEIKGYYRIISSGESFSLVGERTNSKIVLTEYNQEQQEIGLITAENFSFNDESAHFVWYNLSQTDILDFRLTKSHFSDYPSSVFKPTVLKYSGVNAGVEERFLIEVINENELIVHHSTAEAESEYRTNVLHIDPLKFKVNNLDKEVVFDQLVNGKLRCRRDNQFYYFALDNQLEIKKISYASSNFLCDVDYPVTSNEVFNDWIKSLLDDRKQKIRAEIRSLVGLDSYNPAEKHFGHKWLGWTEIDVLNDQLISGRIVLNSSWNDQLETIPFHFNFVEDELFDILDQFKSDFNAREYLDKFLVSELQKSPNSREVNENNLTEGDFNILNISENSLVLSTAFHWKYGYKKISIPYSELEGLVKRNSILKNLMKS